jgi:FkbM family methyltransferase
MIKLYFSDLIRFISKNNILNSFFRNKLINFFFHERHEPFKIIRKFYINKKYFVDICCNIYDYSQILQVAKPEYESDIFNFYLNNLNKNYVFLDIGSNIGIHSFFIKKYCNLKDVISVEPNKKCIFLQKKTFSFDKKLKIKIINKIISHKKINILSEFNNNSGSGTINNDFGKDIVLSANINKSFCLSQKPSNLLKKIQKKKPTNKIAIKLDIQGSEYDFLRSIKSILTKKNNIEFIIFEINKNNYYLMKDLIKGISPKYILKDLFNNRIDINYIKMKKILKKNLLLIKKIN